ncbi:DUF6252 family protein [Adhaeribacter soli]|uniref:Uncharacterized protein n=1 Tax=Adhaeribacter soli TaxID=2607655 RepID=A0A5N1J3Z5_9BACT|nr:DUF6252 family protein [Adhaeribacter soli]KAA9340815.1 hypothetical protein F0P94_05140 [Adhaeribacter soli]
MKLKLFYACAFAAALVFTSCEKKDKDPVVKPKPANSFTAKVDGADWAAVVPMAANQDRDFVLGGANMNGESIGLFTSYQPDIKQLGTYAVRAIYVVAPPGSSFGPTWANPNASVTITKWDTVANLVSGTFTFMGVADTSTGASGTKTITDGSFTDIPLQ